MLKGIYNMTPERHGDVAIAGVPVFHRPPHELLRRGTGLLPATAHHFPEAHGRREPGDGGYLIKDRQLLAERIAGVEAMFPVLAVRRAQYAASLSGR